MVSLLISPVLELTFEVEGGQVLHVEGAYSVVD
jgi:hypothetical protein